MNQVPLAGNKAAPSGNGSGGVGTRAARPSRAILKLTRPPVITIGAGSDPGPHENGLAQAPVALPPSEPAARTPSPAATHNRIGREPRT